LTVLGILSTSFERLLLAENCLLAQFVERLLRRKQPLKSSTPESPIAVIQNLNVIGCKQGALLRHSLTPHFSGILCSAAEQNVRLQMLLAAAL
jgi:hypothetical protein